MAKNTTKTEVVTIQPMNVKHAIICIEGSTDLVLNRMNASNTRALLTEDRKAQALWERQHQNKWENIITAIHWRDPLPMEDTNSESSEELFYKLLKENAPCISSFGLKKSWGQAVVQNNISKYSTNFAASVNIVSPNGLVPITFAEWRLDERLMSPKRGAPVSVALSHFLNWKAEIPIEYTEGTYSFQEIVTIINAAGFGIGIGSGRTSGYGRYSVSDIK